jgi:hypothetical protein
VSLASLFGGATQSDRNEGRKCHTVGAANSFSSAPRAEIRAWRKVRRHRQVLRYQLIPRPILADARAMLGM